MLEGELSHFMCNKSENEKNKKNDMSVSGNTYVMLYFACSAIDSAGGA